MPKTETKKNNGTLRRRTFTGPSKAPYGGHINYERYGRHTKPTLSQSNKEPAKGDAGKIRKVEKMRELAEIQMRKLKEKKR